MDILEVGALCHENKKDTQIAVVVQKKRTKAQSMLSITFTLY